MVTKKRVDSWVVTDDFWQRVEPLIPVRERSADKEYARKPGAGRPPKPARQVFEAVVYVLRTGCQWKALPKERFGSASAVHKRFLEWEKAGVFEAIWKAGLAEYDHASDEQKTLIDVRFRLLAFVPTVSAIAIKAGHRDSSVASAASSMTTSPRAASRRLSR